MAGLRIILSKTYLLRRAGALLAGALALLYSGPLLAACPDLSQYSTTPRNTAGWERLRQRLAPLLQQCLRNPDYFALYGAAQLNSGQISEALESLERALLLQPDHGAALVDYSAALYLSGEAMAALALNQALLQRQDLPGPLRPVLERRARLWRARTTEQHTRLGLLAGYDSNLNGAPESDTLTLTLPDGPVELGLGEESRPIGGAHLKLQLSHLNRQQGIDGERQWQLALNSRLSEGGVADLLRLDAEYRRRYPPSAGDWSWTADMSYLRYAGRNLYAAAGLEGRIYWRDGVCRPDAGLGLQLQHFPGQPLDGLEWRLGLACNTGGGGARLGLEWISNQTLDAGRPGGSRSGWEMQATWRLRLYQGTLTTQLQYTRLEDAEGYSPLLSADARRQLRRSVVSMQYIRPLAKELSLTLGLYHQRQRSNLDVFENRSTSVDIGISLNF